MKKRIIKIFCFIILTSAWMTCVKHVSAAAFSDPDTSLKNIYYNTSATFVFQPDTNLFVDDGKIKAGLLYDVDNKKIVWQKEMNNAYPIASLTKMMVALLTTEDVYAGKVKWEDNVQWTRESIVGNRKKKHKVYSLVNFTLHDLLKAAMIASNNEAAEQMAKYVGGGDLQSFITRMNVRAKELGMTATYYGNPTGLPGYSSMFDNSATPVDLLKLALEIIKYNEILEVTGMGYADINNGGYVNTIRNHNHLAIEYNGEVDGMKTGYTKRAGFCLVATANKCEHRLISIVLGSRGPQMRNDAVSAMISDYYSSIGLDRLGPYCAAPVSTAVINSSGDKSSSDQFTYVTKKMKKIHRVYKGESLTVIADKYDCSYADLKKWNHLRSGKVSVGKKLIVYVTIREKVPVKNISQKNNLKEEEESSEEISTSDSKSVVAQKVAVLNKEKPKYIVYTVQPGDTLFNIAQRYQGVTVSQIKTVNKISNHRNLKIGTKLKVPVNS